MDIISLNIGAKAQVVIPKRARKAIGLVVGKPATLLVQEGIGILLGDPVKYGQKLRGLGKEIWRKAGGGSKYLQQERKSWDES